MSIDILKGTLFIDIDGTILHSDTEQPLSGAIEKINKAYNDGFRIVLTTFRGGEWKITHRFSKINTERTLKSINLKFHEIIWDSPSPRIIINDDQVLAIKHEKDKSWDYINFEDTQNE